MPDLRNALYQAGLTDKRQLHEEELLAKRREETPLVSLLERQSKIEKRLVVLAETRTPQEFRREARQALLGCPVPALLQAVIDLFHNKQMWKQDGGKRLRGNLYRLKSLFGPTPKSEWNRMVELELPEK